ncbi:MAG: hypothetical protein LT071_10730, partial [Nocardioides sp.]|nr:hypothetical protein [Nocardioides sp.]
MSWAAVRWTGVAAFAAILLALLGLLAWSPGADRPHDAPVAVVAPGLVSDMLVSAYGRDEDHVRPVSYDDEAQARRALADGDVVAVVLVDLGRSTDEVLVDRSRDRDLVAGVVARIEVLEHARGRKTSVVDATAEGREGKAEQVDDAALVACVGGFFVGLTHVVGAWARGRPIPTAPRLAVAMTGGSLLVGALVAVVPPLGVGAPWWLELSAAALAALASSALAVVLSRASRELGVAVASGIQLVSAAPLLRHVDQLMLPEPWLTAFPFTIIGAGRELLASVESGIAVRPVLVLGTWLLAAPFGGSFASNRTRLWHD